MGEWIVEIRFTDSVARKLRTKHHITSDQLRIAVAHDAAHWTIWDDDPRYGRRLIAAGSDAEGPIVVYLMPIDRSEGVWQCLTAWRAKSLTKRSKKPSR